MDRNTTCIGLDVSKVTIAVAIAEGGRRGEVRFYGSISSKPEAITKLIETLASTHGNLAFAYEAGPTGYGLYRQLTQLGYACHVVAPSMTPARPGSQIKTDRRDTVALASLFRAGELTSIWVPDIEHEAMRDPRSCADFSCGSCSPNPTATCCHFFYVTAGSTSHPALDQEASPLARRPAV